MKKSVTIIGIILIIAAALVLVFVLFGQSGNLGQKMQGSDIRKTGNSWEDIKDSVNISITVPDFLLAEDNLKYTSILGEQVQISNERALLCAAKFINTSANISGKTGEYDFKKFYTVNGNDLGIKYLRYWCSSSETVVEWYTEDVMYGLTMQGYDGYNGFSALVHGLGIEDEQLQETEEPGHSMEEAEIKSTVELEKHEISQLGMSISLPKTDINILENVELLRDGDTNDRVTFIVYNEILLIMEQTTTASDAKSPLMNYIETDAGYTLEYFNNNPYKTDSEAYELYEALKENINNIAETVEVLE